VGALLRAGTGARPYREVKMKKSLIGLLAIAGFFIFCFINYGSIYNRLVGSEEAVKSAWAQVQNVYQRRLDLIPNLVETVKGYVAHERQTLEGVVEARSKISQMNISADVLSSPEQMAKFQALQTQLSSALSRLLVVAEQYPELKANQNFLTLQAQLEGTENRITVERKRFNDAAQNFNTLIRVFPNNIVARMAHFQAKAYFQAEEAAQSVPKVKF